MKNPILEKIQSRGYWRINFEPLVYQEKLKTLGECKDIVEKNRVQLRGWDYPHFPRRSDENAGLEPGNKFYEGWDAWYNHIELWRMYQSGQFLHYIAVREDWSELDGWGIVANRNIESGTELSVTGEIVYEITEIYEFLSRLAKKGIYDEGARVSISLNKTRGRKLAVRDPGRFPLMREYKTGTDKIELGQEYTKEELLTKPKELAFETIIQTFDKFGWHNPPTEVIARDQENLLNKRP